MSQETERRLETRGRLRANSALLRLSRYPLGQPRNSNIQVVAEDLSGLDHTPSAFEYLAATTARLLVETAADGVTFEIVGYAEPLAVAGGGLVKQTMTIQYGAGPVVHVCIISTIRKGHALSWYLTAHSNKALLDLDITSDTSVNDFMTALFAHPAYPGQIDILINNAARYVVGTITPPPIAPDPSRSSERAGDPRGGPVG